MAKTEIRLAVTRKINTDKFESLDVIADITEIIEWESEADRKQKSSKVVGHLIDDFRNTYNTLVAEIGVKRSIGTGTLTNGKDGTEKKGNVITDNDDLDFDVLD